MDTSKSYRIFGIEDIEQDTIEQFMDTLYEDFSIKGALMADAHLGYAMPIGGVIVTKGHLVPAWVGYDIGCGVLAVETAYNFEDVIDFNEYIYDDILKEVPVGFNHHEKNSAWERYNSTPKTPELMDMFEAKKGTGFRQLGTLGGGNHFIEIAVSNNDNAVWIVVHSGSRNIGHKVATHYMKLASPDGKCREENFPLSDRSVSGLCYKTDHDFCQTFALENRLRIAHAVGQSIGTYCTGEVWWENMINRNHNFVEFSMTHGGWLHRKGATNAKDGVLGVIPGNMRDGSFIVSGRGYSPSIDSASHGAGRLYSRKKAKEKLDLADFVDDMEGVFTAVRKDLLDESPRAYKSISEVMKAQDECVKVKDWLKPLINVKG